MADYYETLGVAPGASAREVRAAYRRLALACHPDRSAAPDAAQKFLAITEAYDVLGAPERRRAYDELRRYHGRPDPYRPKSAERAGARALTWVDEFFIQAGGIEAEGPGKGSLKRFTAGELEAIWRAVASRVAQSGEVRVGVQYFELVLRYVERHPEVRLPAGASARLAEKHAALLELEALRRGTAVAWTGLPPALEDLLRTQRFAEARSLLVWRAAHRAAERLRENGLFAPAPPVVPPVREIAMVDRLEALARGAPAERRLGHGYTACRRCGGWAMTLGVGAPRCAVCGSARLALRPRDERDDYLAALIERRAPRFWGQENRRRAAAVQGRLRWQAFPALLLTALVTTPVGFAARAGWAWAALVWAAAALAALAWRAADVVPADTDLKYPDEQEWARVIAEGAGIAATVLAALLVLVWLVSAA